MSKRLPRPGIGRRAARISKAGREAFGPLWQSAMARSIGVSQSYIAMVAQGDRRVTDELYRKISNGLLNEAERLRERAARTNELAQRILRDLAD